MPYHVTYYEKDMVFESDDKNTILESVMDVFQVHLKQNQFLLFKTWNEKWGAWCDTAVDNLPDECKLKVVIDQRIESALNLEHQTALSGAMKVLYNINDAGQLRTPDSYRTALSSRASSAYLEMDLESEAEQAPLLLPHTDNMTVYPSTPTPQTRPTTPALPDCRPSTSALPDCRPSTAALPVCRPLIPPAVCAPNNKRCGQSSNWPQPFVLRDLPRSLVNSKLPLSFRARTSVTEQLYLQAANYAMYPLPGNVIEAAQALVTKYPQWSDPTAAAAPWSCWQRRLVDKFKNERRYNHPEGPDITPKRKKTVAKKATQLQFDLPEGEDAASIKLHLKWLKQEYKKAVIDKAKVSDIMDITFAARRQIATLAEVKKLYPFILDAYELILEINRLKGVDMLVSARDNLARLKLLIKVSSEKSRDQDAALTSILVQLPEYFGDKYEDLFMDSIPDNDPAPVLVVAGGDLRKGLHGKTCTLYAEGLTVFSEVPPFQSIAAFLALHYCFNMQYKRKLACIGVLEQLFGLECSINVRRRKYNDFCKAWENCKQ